MNVSEQRKMYPSRIPLSDSRGYPDSVEDIVHLTSRIWFWVAVFFGGTCGIWIWRISEYKNARIKSGQDYTFWKSAIDIIFVSKGVVPLLINFVSIAVMVYFWRLFHQHMLVSCEAVPTPSKISSSAQRRLAALNEPAGDIFTLIGIAFTFLGLSVSMLTISAEIIEALTSGSGDVGQQLAQSAIVFGASLGIGLLGSLFGVILAVEARWIAAQCCPEVPQPWQTANAIDHLHSIPEFLAGRGAPVSAPALDATVLAEALASALALTPVLERLSSSMDQLSDALARPPPEPDPRVGLASADIVKTLRRLPQKLEDVLHIRLKAATSELVEALREVRPDAAQPLEMAEPRGEG